MCRWLGRVAEVAALDEREGAHARREDFPVSDPRRQLDILDPSDRQCRRLGPPREPDDVWTDRLGTVVEHDLEVLGICRDFPDVDLFPRIADRLEVVNAPDRARAPLTQRRTSLLNLRRVA